MLVQVLGVVGVLALIVVGSVVVLRLARSPADAAVALTGGGAGRARDDVEHAAAEHGWQVRRGVDLGGRDYPRDLRRARVPAEACEMLVEGTSPRPFTAETWRVRPARVGGLATSGRQHLTTMSLATNSTTDPGAVRPAPRFALARAGLLGMAWELLPDDLLGRDARRPVDGVQVWGDDGGLLARLRPLLASVVAAEVWVVVDGDRLVLLRAGELDAAGLLDRVDLAGRLAVALERSRG